METGTSKKPSLTRLSLVAWLWYALCIIGLQESKGLYHLWALILHLVSLGGMAVFLLRPDQWNRSLSPKNQAIFPWLLYLLIFYLFILQWGKSHILYPERPDWTQVTIVLRTVASAIGILVLLPPLFRRLEKMLGTEPLSYGLFFLFLALGTGAMVAGVLASPKPAIDVFVFAKEGSQALIDGKNPYAIDYTNIYDLATGYYPDGRASHQPYPPLSVFFSLLGYLLGEVRLALIVMHAMACTIGFFLLKRFHATPLERVVLPASMIFFPRAVFGIEQSWTDPLLVGAWACFAWFDGERETDSQASSLASLFAGMAFALKQTMAPFLLHLIFWKRLRGPKSWGLFLFPALLTITPFFLWNAGAFIEDIVIFHLKTPFRPDGVTLSSLVFRLTGHPLPAITAVLGILGAVILSFVVSRRTDSKQVAPLFWLTFAAGYLLILLTAKHAFFNYYYFHLFLVWMGYIASRRSI